MVCTATVHDAALAGRNATISTLATELEAAVTKTKFKSARPAAMSTFANFIDARVQVPAIYAAAQENLLPTVRILASISSDLNARDTEIGGTAAHVAAIHGHTRMIRLLGDLRADLHQQRRDEYRPSVSSGKH